METIKMENKRLVIEIVIDDVGWADWDNEDYILEKLRGIEQDICGQTKEMFLSEIVYVQARLDIEEIEKTIIIKESIMNESKWDSRRY
jgi:hypothetical protein